MGEGGKGNHLAILGDIGRYPRKVKSDIGPTLRKLPPWAAFLFAIAILKVGEYAIAELALVVSAVAFLWRIYSSPGAKPHRGLLTLIVLGAWLFSAVVFYNVKGHRPWSNVQIGSTAQIEIRPMVMFVNAEGGAAKLWVSSSDPFRVRPSNLALYVNLTNQGPASTAISDIYVETKGPTFF